MNSPISGKPMQLVTNIEMIKYKGVEYAINHTSWHDKENDEYFTTDKLDTYHLNQLYSQAGEFDKVEPIPE